MSAFVVEAAAEIAAAINGHNFAYGPIVADWDYDTLTPDSGLVAESLSVRVIVPREYRDASRFSQTNLRYAAGFDVDVRYKFGIPSQGDKAPDIPREAVAPFSQLLEDIHEFFHEFEPRLGPSEDIVWISQDDDVEATSTILMAYDPKMLREKSLFYGVAREFFWMAR